MPDGWGMMHDGDFLTDLTKLYEEATKDGTPYFNFSVTYQNHGPYEDDKRASDTTYYSADGLSEQGSNIFNNYLAGIHETDQAMRKYVDYFRNIDEPVILVFFGDHNPWLGDGSWVYDELGIDIDLSTDEGFYNHFETPYVIWANQAAKDTLGNDFTGDGGTFSPCFLMSGIFDLCSWEGNELIKINRELKEYTDVVHVTGAVREDGVLGEDPSEETKSALKSYLMRDRY